ncbi:MAG: hypothetical protein PHV06_04440 [bacterium]|nr:hypothetical protein [bacterium]
MFKLKGIALILFMVLITSFVFSSEFPKSSSNDFDKDIVFVVDRIEIPSGTDAYYYIYYFKVFIRSLKLDMPSGADKNYHANLYLKIKVTDTKSGKEVLAQEFKRPLTAATISNASFHVEYFGVELKPGTYKVEVVILDTFAESDGKVPEGTKQAVFTDDLNLYPRQSTLLISDPILTAKPIEAAKGGSQDFVIGSLYVYPNVDHITGSSLPFGLFFTINNLKMINGNARIEIEYTLKKDGAVFFFIKEVLDAQFQDIIHAVNPGRFASVYSLNPGTYSLEVKVLDMNGTTSSTKEILINLSK